LFQRKKLQSDFAAFFFALLKGIKRAFLQKNGYRKFYQTKRRSKE